MSTFFSIYKRLFKFIFIADDLTVFAFRHEGVGLEIVSCVTQNVVYLFLCLLIDSGILGRIYSLYKRRVELPSDEDSDVKMQRQEVMDPQAPFSNMLVIRDCSHFYGSHCAVRKISCVIAKGECFGLLGVNGAGKTTTFKMLTGEVP